MAEIRESKTFFVTGTDTDVGKTICCKALLQSANKQNITTLAYKPIAAGCSLTIDGLRNEDALILQENCSVDVTYHDVNPISLQLAIAPHIAAKLENKTIKLMDISRGLKVLQEKDAEVIIVEGAGGWRLPLNDQETLSDWVIAQELPVILVVGMKLGCLNHALLTYETIINDGLKVIGWIANQLHTDMPYYQENLQLLSAKIDAPLIAEIPHLNEVKDIDLAQFVSFSFK
ncbi:MAG: dethiobiotin synthetase [Psychromonas sp.]|jgi:dethiobiotin synthetase|uniref:dethiobiotin synthase n=1 Tax=Psychromonas sp. TaxID=1884585 RepID=UPI0039E5EA89